MKPKITPAVVLSARLGGAVTRQHPINGPSLEDLLPYTPRVDRADFQAWTQDDTCPQIRTNYP